jgi:Peroxidase, family 2
MKLPTIFLFASGVAAFPTVLQAVEKRQGLPSQTQAQAISKARTDCGTCPCLVFDGEAAHISTTGEHAYASPLASQIRGPCPGLNAAANHGYLPRNGMCSTNIS